MSEDLDRRAVALLSGHDAAPTVGSRARRASRKVNVAMLLPDTHDVARQLRRFRVWERMMLAAPGDRAMRAGFEESGATLSALMGARCAREAADAAERHLSGDAEAHRHERCAHPQVNPSRRRAHRQRSTGAPR